MDRIEDWWDRGPGSRIPKVSGINHNLGVYGWDLRDTLERTADTLQSQIEEPRDHLFRQIVEDANERASLRVLAPARGEDGEALTPLEAADRLGSEGAAEEPDDDGIETLIVLLGSNNALASMLRLEVVWSEEGYDDLEKKRRFTMWNPVHFRSELELVAEEVRKVRARHVIWGTAPHVTLALRVGDKGRKGSLYFPYYTRPWLPDRDFDAKNDPHVTGAEARAIDQYNDAIAETVRQARNEGRGWLLFDAAGLLERLVSRRYIDDPLTRPTRTSSPRDRMDARPAACSRSTGSTRPPSATAYSPRN